MCPVHDKPTNDNVSILIPEVANPGYEVQAASAIGVLAIVGRNWK
jgi:hypothetical protein